MKDEPTIFDKALCALAEDCEDPDDSSPHPWSAIACLKFVDSVSKTMAIAIDTDPALVWSVATNLDGCVSLAMQSLTSGRLTFRFYRGHGIQARRISANDGAISEYDLLSCESGHAEDLILGLVTEGP